MPQHLGGLREGPLGKGSRLKRSQAGRLHATVIQSSVATLTSCLSGSTSALYLCACFSLWLFGLAFSPSHHCKLRHLNMSPPPAQSVPCDCKTLMYAEAGRCSIAKLLTAQVPPVPPQCANVPCFPLFPRPPAGMRHPAYLLELSAVECLQDGIGNGPCLSPPKGSPPCKHLLKLDPGLQGVGAHSSLLFLWKALLAL